MSAVFVTVANDCNFTVDVLASVDSCRSLSLLPLLVFVKVYADATLVFPLLVAETFARNYKVPPACLETTEKEDKEQ